MKALRALAVALIMIVIPAASWGGGIATYVAEFSVKGASKPEEEKSTIQTMLLSRLAGERISTQARPEGAEIKVTGSYIVMGSAFSLDAEAVNSTGAIIVRAFAQGKNPDELISAVGALSQTLSVGIVKTLQATSAAPDIIKPPRSAPVTGRVVHQISGAMSGLAMGRTLAGGERELFVIGSHLLRYYRLGSELKLMFEVPYKVNEKILAVDSTDLDGNLIPEIYVTIMNGELLESQVWTVDGTSLKQIAGPIPYFFRMISGADGVRKLYAQKSSGKNDFEGDVAEVVKSDKAYSLANPLKLPKGGNLYNFSLYAAKPGEQGVVLMDHSGNLRQFDASSKEVWKSSDEYGGSETFFNRSDRNTESGVRQVYLEQRMYATGKGGGLLVPKNSSSWFMLNKHYYSGNSMYCFTWDGAGFEEKWHTKQIDHYLADFAYDETNHELLMLEVVEKEEGVLDKGVSSLVIRKVDL